MSKKILNIVLPTIQAMMTGVWRIQRAHNLTVLHYTDGTTESGEINEIEWRDIGNEPFQVISRVQSQRKTKGGE